MPDMTDATPTIEEMPEMQPSAGERVTEHEHVYRGVYFVAPGNAVRLVEEAYRDGYQAALSSLSPLIEAAREVLQQLDKGYDNVAIYKLGAVRDALSTFPAPEHHAGCEIAEKLSDTCTCGATFSAPASPWRPIETAPKDGTYILGNKRFLDAGWSPRVLRWEKGAWLTDPGDRSQKPEVWQPLPAPPTTSDGSK